MIKRGDYDKSLHDRNFKVYLRYSDLSRDCWYFNKKINTRDIFLNTLKVFGADKINVILDNSSEETLEWMKEVSSGKSTIIKSEFGFGGAFMLAFKSCIETMADDDIVYFLEDDYVHKPESPNIILEGLSHFDYITLLDSYYKYTLRDRDSETPSLFKISESCHWRSITTTPCTWACKVSTLKEDLDIHISWIRSLKRNPWTEKGIDFFNKNYAQHYSPIDQSEFASGLPECCLYDRLLKKGRTLGQPIPGYADHINDRIRKLHTPFTDWIKVLDDSLEN